MFKKQIQFINQLEITFFETMQEAFNDNGYVLKNILIDEQMFERGIDGDGKKIKPGYTRRTIRLKISKSQPADRVTLRDSKEWHESITIEGNQDHLEISSNVSYDKYILKKYGRKVLKITNENMKDFLLTYFIPKLKEKLKHE